MEYVGLSFSEIVFQFRERGDVKQSSAFRWDDSTHGTRVGHGIKWDKPQRRRR